MPRVVIVWKDNCPKCDYVKKVFIDHKMCKGIDLTLLNGMAPDKQTFLKKHDVNLVPVVLFYDKNGQVTKAKKHTARGLNEDFKYHTGRNLFKYFA